VEHAQITKPTNTSLIAYLTRKLPRIEIGKNPLYTRKAKTIPDHNKTNKTTSFLVY